MLSPSRTLVVHGVSEAAWCARWGIVPFEHPCGQCGAPRRTSVPAAEGNLRGLLAPPCSCGNTERMYCVVSATSNLLARRR